MLTAEGILTALGAALVGATVTMIGWFVNDLQRRGDARRTRLIEFTQRQIHELYAPLSMLAASERSYRKLREDVSRFVPEDRRPEVWWRCTERYVHPAQKEIFDLLQEKRFLFVQGPHPKSFDLALEHCSRALVLFELDAAGIGNLSGVQAPPMPDGFSADVEQILSTLQSKLNELMALKGP